MKSQIHPLFILLVAISLIIGCGKTSHSKKKSSSQNDSNSVENPNVDTLSNRLLTNNIDPSGEETTLKVLDTSNLFVDTIISLQQNDIVITKAKYDANDKKYSIDDQDFNPITIYIINRSNDSIIFHKEFEENQFVSHFSFQDKSINFISLSIFSGGSGYVSNIYKVELSQPPFLEIAVTYSELTSYLFNKEGSQILIMQGIWDMSDNGDESHFSDHRYEVSAVDLTTSKYQAKALGVTQAKYPCADMDFSAEKLFKQLVQKEPQIFKGFNLEKYPAQ
jgi:hypothetical protein